MRPAYTWLKRYHMRRSSIICLMAGAFVALASALTGQDKKPAEVKEPPRVVVANPLGAAPGVATKFTIRGLRLDSATEIYFPERRQSLPIRSKGKASVPNQQEPTRVGDTQIEMELTLPSDRAGSPLAFVIVSPAGSSPLHHLLVEGALPKKEPNNGFAQAQPVQAGQVIEGVIASPQDVDVYRLEGRAGQRVTFEVLAARLGSAVDSILTLYDAAGRIVASNDDHNGSADSRLELTLPHSGPYYLSLMDAHDLGGPAHIYRLRIEEGK